VFKTILFFVFIVGLIGCNSSVELKNYPGQSNPDSTPKIFAPDIISVKGRFEHGISFTPDYQELAFGILKDDNTGEIFSSKKSNENWTQPSTFKPLKGVSAFLPYFSPDGKSMLFAKSRPDVENGISDIWILNKENDNWIHSEKIASPVSSLARESSACMTLDRTIYFSSNRNCEGKENCFTADLFYAKFIDNEYKTVEAIPEFMSSNDEESIFISPKEDYIIFCRYTDDKTWMDLYISYRDINGKWLVPNMLDSAINSKHWDRRPFVSIDSRILFFTQLQIEDSKLIESDIFWVKTDKVFKPFVFNPIGEQTIQVGNKTEIEIPSNYFLDIDNNIQSISFDEDKVDWARYDDKKMVLVMNPKEIGEFDLTFTAVDSLSNVSIDSLHIIVEK